MEEKLYKDSRRQCRVSNPREREGKVVPLHSMKAYVGMEI
jgi:hypothetical protein